MNFGNLNIGDLQKMLPSQGLGATETVKQTQGGLSALTESSGQAQQLKENKEFNQGSPDLPPPSAGVRVDYSFLVISDEEIKNFFLGSSEAKNFQAEAKNLPSLSNLNLIAELRRAADNEKVEDDGTVDVIKLLKKLLSKIIDQLISGNPNISDVAKEIGAKIKIDLFKEDFPQAGLCMDLLKDEGLQTNQELASSFFGDLEELFKENGKIFSLESSFMPEAIHQFAVGKLIEQGLSPEEAEERANSLLGAASVQKQMTEWVDKISKADVSNIRPKAPTASESDTMLSDIKALIEGSSLPPGEKVSLLDFLKLVSDAIKQIKDLLADMLRLDARKQKELGSSNQMTNRMLNQISDQANMTPETIKAKQDQMRQDLQDALSDQSVKPNDKVSTLEGRDDSLGEFNLSTEAKKMSIQEMQSIVNGDDAQAFAALFSPPLGSGSTGTGLSPLLGSILSPVASNLLDLLMNGSPLKLQLGMQCLHALGADELLMDLFDKLAGMKSTKMLGNAPIDVLVEALLQIINKEKESNPLEANKLFSVLSDILSAAAGAKGTVEEKTAALTFASLLISTLAVGIKGPGELSGGASVPLLTAYLNEIGLNNLALLKFMEAHGLSDGSGGGALGAISGEAALVGFAMALLQGGGHPEDVSACLDFLKTVAQGVNGAGFSGTLANALKEALGLGGGDAASLQQIFGGLLGQIGGTASEEEVTGENAELIKLLKQTLKMLEALLQQLLGGVQGGDIPPDQVLKEANAQLGKILEQFFMGLISEMVKDQAENSAENSIQELEISELTSGSSPEAVQFLINSMLQAGLGPANAGAQPGQAA